MNIENIIREIITLRDALGAVLADTSKPVLSQVLANLHAHKAATDKLPRKAAKPPWTLTIPPDRPLVFLNTDSEEVVKHHLQVDLACSLSEPDANGVPRGEHNIAVRVWATKSDMCFRPGLDADSLKELLIANGRRVMLRFHFDLANRDQPGPRHHLQIGGKGVTNEFGWLPENWKLPRFVHFPVNLALACEFIVRTFYPSRFQKIASEPSWKHAIRSAEEVYLFPFLRTFPYIQVQPGLRTDSLLSAVWNA